MAKGNMLLGKARGSVGDVTFSVLNSEQITRAKAKSVKNPRTEGQMVQRILMSTTIQAYSGMQAIVDHSFQGVPYQGRSMNRFNSLNVKNLRALYAQVAGGNSGIPITFNANGMKRIALAPWILSTGSLPKVAIAEDTEKTADWPVAKTITRRVGNLFVDSGVVLNTLTNVTYADFCAYYGLQQGDQLTLCALTRNHSDEEYGCSFKYGRFILQPNDGDMSHILSDTTVANEKNQNCKFVEDSGLALVFSDLFDAEDENRTYLYAAAIITSRLENQSWKRSNAQFMMATDDLVEGGYDMQEAIDSYNGTDIDTKSPWYLNKAGNATTVEPVGILQPGEVGFTLVAGGKKQLVYNDNGVIKEVAYTQGQDTLGVEIVDSKAFGMSVSEAMTAGYIAPEARLGVTTAKPYTEVVNMVIKYASTE